MGRNKESKTAVNLPKNITLMKISDSKAEVKMSPCMNTLAWVLRLYSFPANIVALILNPVDMEKIEVTLLAGCTVLLVKNTCKQSNPIWCLPSTYFVNCGVL